MRMMRGRSCARLFEQPDAFFARHPLVGHQQADFVLMLLQKLEPVLGAGRGKYPKLVLKRPRERLQRLLFVIHVENGEFFVILNVAHGHLIQFMVCCIDMSSFGRKLQRKLTVFSALALDRYPAFIFLDDAIANGQPQAHPFAHVLGGEERIEDLVRWRRPRCPRRCRGR